MLPRDQYLRRIEQHLTKHWGSFEEQKWASGPMKEVAPDFCVLKFNPSSKQSLFTFATKGMSDQGDAERVECFILSPEPSPALCELMTIVAWFHRTGDRLGLGHIVNFGRPWLTRSSCEYGLFSLPYLAGPNLECLPIDNSQTRFLWLIPITLQERDFAIQLGLEALEQRLEAANFDYANPSRPSVVS